jgi:hypothetical protein
MTKQQTAVEWLFNELDNILELYPSEWEEVSKVVKQANVMFEEQMAMADKNGQDRNQYNHDLEYGGAEYWDDEPLEFEQWYNKTYGGDK